MTNFRLAISAAIASSVLSSLAWVYQGEAVRYLSPIVAACFINLISAGILFVYLWARSSLPSWAELWENRKDILLVSFIRPILAGTVFCYALTLTSGLKMMFFTKLEPYFVLFLAWLLEKQKISFGQLLLLIVHICGAVLLSTNGKFSFDTAQYGDLLVIATVGLISFAYLPASRLSRAVGALKVNMSIMIIGGSFLLPFALLVTPAPLTELPWQGWGNLVVSLLLFQIFGLSFWYFSLGTVQGWLVSALRATGPVFAAPFAYVFYQQKLSSLQIIGAVIVLLTSAMMARGHKKIPSQCLDRDARADF
jgi:drug/metabolite transporter (DMT)-like permease